jgi:hypothetical protein
MKTVTCPACSFTNVNASPESACTNCGEALAPALLQQSVDELKRLTEQLQEAKRPAKSFYSFNGFGTTLLDYRALPDGTYQATRWVIALFLPIFPLKTYLIEPVEQEFGYGRETARFNILGETGLSALRVLRTYLLAAVGLLPAILGVVYSREIDRVVHGLWAVVLMILMFVWGVYFIFYKLKNEGQAYRSRKAAEGERLNQSKPV